MHGATINIIRDIVFYIYHALHGTEG